MITARYNRPARRAREQREPVMATPKPRRPRYLTAYQYPTAYQDDYYYRVVLQPPVPPTGYQHTLSLLAPTEKTAIDSSVCGPQEFGSPTVVLSHVW